MVFLCLGCVPPLFWTSRTQKKHVLGLNDTMGRHNRAICSTHVLQQNMSMKLYQGPASFLFSSNVITSLGIPNVSPPILDVKNPKKKVFELDETMERHCTEATRGWLLDISLFLQAAYSKHYCPLCPSPSIFFTIILAIWPFGSCTPPPDFEHGEPKNSGFKA